MIDRLNYNLSGKPEPKHDAGKSNRRDDPTLGLCRRAYGEGSRRRNATSAGRARSTRGFLLEFSFRLWLAIAISAAMFVIEMAAGTVAGSQALRADALDFLADATTYGISLAVIGASLRC
jgi:hypothetical protein